MTLRPANVVCGRCQPWDRASLGAGRPDDNRFEAMTLSYSRRLLQVWTASSREENKGKRGKGKITHTVGGRPSADLIVLRQNSVGLFESYRSIFGGYGSIGCAKPMLG